MPTDSYGQGVPYLGRDETPNMETLGQGLAEALTELSNMRFASATERDSFLTSPVEGMEAWLEDVNHKTVYDGSSWTVVATSAATWTTLSLASGYTHDGNSNGNAQYTILTIAGARFVLMRGGIGIAYSGGSLPNSGLLLSSALPTTARPTTVRTMNVACSTLSSEVTAFKLDAETNGTLDLAQAASSTPPWVSLNGVMYSL